MRLALLALACVALPAVAQPVLPDSAGSYVTPVFGLSYSTSAGGAYVVGANVGRRVSPSVDVGLGIYAADLTRAGTAPSLTVRPQIGYNRALGGGVVGDVRVSASALAADLNGVGGADGFGLRVLGTTPEATLSRSFPIVGSLRIAPTVGGYAAACATFDVVSRPGAQCAEAGALAGADLRFRVFGLDVSLPIVVPIRLVGNTREASLSEYAPFVTSPGRGLTFRF